MLALQNHTKGRGSAHEVLQGRTAAAAGPDGSSAVTTPWYPHRQQMENIFVGGLVQEFGADMQRRLHFHVHDGRRAANPDDDV